MKQFAVEWKTKWIKKQPCNSTAAVRALLTTEVEGLTGTTDISVQCPLVSVRYFNICKWGLCFWEIHFTCCTLRWADDPDNLVHGCELDTWSAPHRAYKDGRRAHERKIKDEKTFILFSSFRWCVYGTHSSIDPYLTIISQQSLWLSILISLYFLPFGQRHVSGS